MSNSLWARFCRALSRYYDRKAMAAVLSDAASVTPNLTRYTRAASRSDFWWHLSGGLGR